MNFRVFLSKYFPTIKNPETNVDTGIEVDSKDVAIIQVWGLPTHLTCQQAYDFGTYLTVIAKVSAEAAEYALDEKEAKGSVDLRNSWSEILKASL